MKKPFAVFLSVLLLMTCVPLGAVSVSAATVSGVTGDCTWTLDKYSHLTISGNGAMGDYEDKYIDDEYRTTAPWGWNITSVTIEYGVTSIGDYAFYECTSLRSVTIPDSVTSIGDYAFYWCYCLTSVTIPNSVTSIGHSAFSDTGYYNNEANWENDVLYIDNHLIAAKWTISGAYAIKPDTVTISKDAFSSCESLTDIIVPFTNANYCDIDGVLLSKDQRTLITCPGGKSGPYTIPDSVTSIESRAFFACRSLTSMTIPDSVTSIGEGAFYYCSSLTSMTIGNSVASIGDNAFVNCTSLTSVTIPDSVTSIGEAVFSTCTSLTSVTLPDSITSISAGAFIWCGALTSVTIPNSVTSIGRCAFYYCRSLPSVTIPGNVTFIGDNAFYFSENLTDVYYKGNEADKANITIDYGNDYLLNATWHYPLYGDANGDGAVNARDLAILQQYVTDWDVTIDEVAADVNASGDINARDVAMLQQYIAGWDVQLGK